MLSCKQASHLVSQSLDRKLARRELIALRLHLMLCRMCRRFTKQTITIRSMILRLRQQVEMDESISLPTEAKQRIAHVLASRHIQGK